MKKIIYKKLPKSGRLRKFYGHSEKLIVAIAEPSGELREKLGRYVHGYSRAYTIHTYSTGSDAQMALAHIKPHVVFFDVAQPFADGLALLENLAHNLPATCFVALTEECDEATLHRILHSGARLILQKPFGRKEAREIFEHIAAHDFFLPEKMAGTFLNMLRHSVLPASTLKIKFDPVSLQVLELSRQRFTQEKIALRIHRSKAAVKKYCQAIYSKLGVHNMRKALDLVYG